MAKKSRVWDGTAWQELASAQTDLTAYSTTAQMNTAIATGSKILQVVSTVNTATQSTTSTSFVDALTLSITPTSASSKIFISAFITGGSLPSATTIPFRLVRDSTGIFVGDSAGSRVQATGNIIPYSNTNFQSQANVTFLDSPATTSAITYKIQYKAEAGGSSTIYLGRSYADGDATYSLRTPSAGIVLMEVRG